MCEHINGRSAICQTQTADFMLLCHILDCFELKITVFAKIITFNPNENKNITLLYGPKNFDVIYFSISISLTESVFLTKTQL